MQAPVMKYVFTCQNDVYFTRLGMLRHGVFKCKSSSGYF